MAIQTGGTTRIGNLGELQNISSVDSTTAASITSAGVGGGFTQQSTGTLSGATPEITIPDADFVRIYLLSWNHTGTNTEDYMRLRKVGSSSVDGGNNYSENWIHYHSNGNNGSVGKTNTSAPRLMTSYNNTNMNTIIDFHFPRSTSHYAIGTFRNMYAHSYAYAFQVQFTHRHSLGIDRMRIFNFSSATYAGNYEVWTA